MRLFFIFCMGLLFAYANNVDIPLESPVYYQLERLKSRGVIRAELPVFKPYNTTQVHALLDSIEDSRFSKIKRNLHNELNRFEDTSVVETELSLMVANDPTAVPNASGVTLQEGANTLASLRVQAVTRQASAVFVPQYRYLDNDHGPRVNEAYARFVMGNMNLTIGRENLWMGAGREGTLLFSNNAKPLDMIRLSTVQPFRFHPYFHNILDAIFGAMDIDFFLGRLHEYDTIKREDGTFGSGNPKLIGMQMTIRPFDAFSLGIYRTAMYGGGGRDEGVKTFFKALFPFGQSENTGTPNEPGDQKAGANLEVYLPNAWQPLKLYGEWAGEDSAGSWPSRDSYLTGVVLADTAGIEGLMASYEYLKMLEGFGNYWYNHHIYQDGYTNDGMLMGHYNGGTGTRHTLRLRYLKGVQSEWTAAWEHAEDDGSTRDALRAGFRYRFNANLELSMQGIAIAHTPWIEAKVKWLF